MSSSSNFGGLNLGAAVSAAAAPASSTQPENPAPKREPKPADKRGWWWGTGRRKTAVARVRLRPVTDPAKAIVTIKTDRKTSKTLEQFFSELRDRNDATLPFKVTGMEGRFEVVAQVHGGGTMGQAQAVRLGVSRALRDYDPTLDKTLRDAGFLTRDSREVERKKYGLAGARRRFQFSKR